MVSIKIKKGNTILITFGYESRELALACYKKILQKGAVAIPRCHLPGFGYSYYKYATDEILKRFPKIAMFEAKNIQGVIHLDTEYNTREMSNVDPKRMAMRRKASEKVSDYVVDKDNWVLCGYPTQAMAQEAEMSLEEYEDFFFHAVLQDWKKESKRQEVLQKILEKAEKVHIIGEGTDLKFSIKGKHAKKCDGTRNMPDGEVFTEPVKGSVHGKIHYTFPAIYGGREVEDIKLEFKNGKVVKASAKKNEKFLKEMLKMDAGASYIGEFGVGVNYGIQKYTKDILFDEKIGGTIHLALGRAYKETGGENKSALHWDMIKDLRKNGELWIDGKLIQKNGKFKIKF